VVIMVNAGMTASARTLGAHPVGQPMPDRQLEGHVLQPLVMVLAFTENDQCCSSKVTTLALVQGSAM
jgi:hypothetical protein